MVPFQVEKPSKSNNGEIWLASDFRVAIQRNECGCNACSSLEPLGPTTALSMCNPYSITTNQEAIRQLFRVVNRYVGNLPPMPGVFPDYPASVIRNAGAERELPFNRLSEDLAERGGRADPSQGNAGDPDHG
jgi:hypothetical protein